MGDRLSINTIQEDEDFSWYWNIETEQRLEHQVHEIIRYFFRKKICLDGERKIPEPYTLLNIPRNQYEFITDVLVLNAYATQLSRLNGRMLGDRKKDDPSYQQVREVCQHISRELTEAYERIRTKELRDAFYEQWGPKRRFCDLDGALSLEDVKQALHERREYGELLCDYEDDTQLHIIELGQAELLIDVIIQTAEKIVTIQDKKSRDSVIDLAETFIRSVRPMDLQCKCIELFQKRVNGRT